MKALVTGATGFVGSHLVEALVQFGAQVTALVRSPHKAEPLQRLGVRQVAGHLLDPDALRQAVAGQDRIFHVAGLVAARSEAEFLQANREGTARLVEAAREGGGRTRLVLVSSLAAAGPSAAGTPLRGEEPARPVTVYGRSKLAGEEVVRASGMEWVIVRPPMVYGPRDTEVLKLFRLARSGLIPVFGDGRQELSAVYGPDLAAALLAAALAPRAAGRTYHACHPEVFSSEGFVRAVADAVRPGAAPPRVVRLPRWVAHGALALTSAAASFTRRPTLLTPDKANEFFAPAWTGDPGPLMDETGWRPRHDLRAGLAGTASWYRTQGWL